MGKRKLPKRLGLGIFYVLAFALALIIILHTNSLADPQTERLKKICGCTLIAVS